MEKGSVLLVEDNLDDEALLRLVWKKNRIQHDLIVAHDGVEALELLLYSDSQTHPVKQLQPDLMLLDVKMPRLSGLDVLKEVRRDPRTLLLPVVLLSLSIDEQDLIDGYLLGANSYVRKPVDFIQFSETMSRVLDYWLVHNHPPPRA